MNNPSAMAATSAQRLESHQRLEGLMAGVAAMVQQAARDLDLHRIDAAERNLGAALAASPEHPEIQRLHGVLCHRRNRPQDALAAFRRTLTSWPDDALALGNLASVLADHGKPEAALDAFRRATEVAPEFAPGWYNFGKALEMLAYTGEAREALERAIELDPDHIPARILHAETVNMCGDAGAAAAAFRRIIHDAPMAVRAWLGLVNLKVEPLHEAELVALKRLLEQRGLNDDDRAIAGFALGKAMEQQSCHAEAFEVFVVANAVKRRLLPWNAAEFRAGIEQIGAAFSEPVAGADEGRLGHEVIFLVGLPRSGSTLVEQILGAHPQVEGAGELSDLDVVLAEESRYRGEPFPLWIGRATPADWSRIGRRYLKRTARWRTKRPRFTDKRPENWVLVGAARAMLPGARFVDCRRDPLETCWSCFTQMFGPGRLAAMYELDDIASYWHDHQRLSELWQRNDMQGFRIQSYEALIASPETEIRALLDFCGLPFDAACLTPHQSTRTVRSVSAAQVRQPLRTDTARTIHYGDRLSRLRAALAAEAATPGESN